MKRFNSQYIFGMVEVVLKKLTLCSRPSRRSSWLGKGLKVIVVLVYNIVVFFLLDLGFREQLVKNSLSNEESCLGLYIRTTNQSLCVYD